MADLAILVILFLGLVSGLRRGFFKEAIAVLAILVATWFAIQVYAAAGPFAAEKLGIPADVGYIVGGVGTWILAYVGTVLVGRILWKSIRGKGPVKRLEDVAGGAADAAAGQTDAGPVTRMLRPIPTRAGVLYWVDKVLGGALGLAQAALLVILAMFAAMAMPMGKAGAMIRGSNAYGLFKTDIEPELSKIPEVKVVRSIGDMTQLAEAVKERPERLNRLRSHPAFDRIRAYRPVQELADDHDLTTALEGNHYGDALKNPKILALLKDREFRRLLSEIDWDGVTTDLEAAERPPLDPNAPQPPAGPEGSRKVAPPGTGPGTPPPPPPPPAPKTGEF